MPKKIFISTKTSNSLDPNDIQYISFEFSKIIADKIRTDETLSKEFEVILADPSNLSQTGINYWDYCSTSVQTSDYFILVILDKEAISISKNPLPEFPEEKTNYIEKEAEFFLEKFPDKVELGKRLIIITSDEIRSDDVKNLPTGLPTLKYFLTSFTKLPPVFDKNETSIAKQINNRELILKNLLINLQNKSTGQPSNQKEESVTETLSDYKDCFDSPEKYETAKGKIEILADMQYKKEAQSEQIIDEIKIVESLMFCDRIQLNDLKDVEKVKKFLQNYFDLLPRYKKNELPIKLKIDKFKKFIDNYIKNFTSVRDYVNYFLRLKGLKEDFSDKKLDEEIRSIFNRKKKTVPQDLQAKLVLRSFLDWFKVREMKIKELSRIYENIEKIYSVEIKIARLFTFKLPYVDKKFFSNEFKKVIEFENLNSKKNLILKEFCDYIDLSEKDDISIDLNSLLIFKRESRSKSILGSSTSSIRVINVKEFFNN